MENLNDVNLAKKWLKEDTVNHPSHYNYGDIEVIDFIEQVTQLRFMDEYTQWSKKLHQDRYRFVEKYDIVMEKYKYS